MLFRSNLDKKTVILTGSAGLLGTEFANVLSQAGANVVLIDIEHKKNEKLSRDLVRKFRTKPLVLDLDITKPKDVLEIKNRTLEKYGQIDVLINNAQFVPRNDPKRNTPFEFYPLDFWEKTITTNLTSLFLCSQEIGKTMVKQKSGVIVNISSIYGVVGADQRIYGDSKLNSPASYAATKGAIINLTRYLAAYWHRKNIRVNTLTLGGVRDTSYMDNDFVSNYSYRTILGRMAQKTDYNTALLFLASDASSYMTGSNLIIDGGWTAW